MILAVVGMRREAALLARAGVPAWVAGRDSVADRLDLRLAQAGDERIEGLLSFGVAGGLDPALRAGDVVIASRVVFSSALNALAASTAWFDRGADESSSALPKQSALGALSALGPKPRGSGPDRPGSASALRETSALSALDADQAGAERLAAMIPGARVGGVLGQDAPVSTAVDKAVLFSSAGALACDMESHTVAAAAARHGLPFAVVRAVSDPAHRGLPAAALAGFGADGQADIGAVLACLARDPRQLLALIRTGVEAEMAFRALRAALAAIGPGLRVLGKTV